MQRCKLHTHDAWQNRKSETQARNPATLNAKGQNAKPENLLSTLIRAAEWTRGQIKLPELKRAYLQ